MQTNISTPTLINQVHGSVTKSDVYLNNSALKETHKAYNYLDKSSSMVAGSTSLSQRERLMLCPGMNYWAVSILLFLLDPHRPPSKIVKQTSNGSIRFNILC